MAEVIDGAYRCTACGMEVTTAFCPNDGTPMPTSGGKRVLPYAGQACEASGGHVLKVPYWPPRKHPSDPGEASMNVQCERCRVHMVLYESSPLRLGETAKIMDTAGAVIGAKVEPVIASGRRG